MSTARHVHIITLTFGFLYKDEGKLFYLTTHLTYFIYGYMASDIW